MEGSSANIVDTNSGEVLGQVNGDRSGKLVYVVDRPKFKEPFIMVFQEYLLYVAQLDLHGTDVKVLMVLLAHCEFENRVIISQKRIAELLQIKQSQVCRSMSRLIKNDLVSKSDNVYYVASYLTWRGRVANFPTALSGSPTRPRPNIRPPAM